MSDTPKTLLIPLPDGRRLPCALRHSPRARRIRLTISPQGQIALVVPQRECLTQHQAQDILHERAAWVARVLDRLQQHAVPSSPLEIPASITLPALGVVRQVVVCPEMATGGDARVTLHDDGARLSFYGAVSQVPSCCALLRRWLLTMAKPWLTALVERMAAETGLAIAAVHVRGQRTRWGSCSNRRVLNLNYRLLLLPDHLIRYLILHELCHLRHMNHSPAYRAFLAQFEPRWKEHEQALTQAWRTLPRWVTAKD